MALLPESDRLPQESKDCMTSCHVLALRLPFNPFLSRSSGNPVRLCTGNSYLALWWIVFHMYMAFLHRVWYPPADSQYCMLMQLSRPLCAKRIESLLVLG